MENLTLTIMISAAVAAVVFLVTFFSVRSHYRRKLNDSKMEMIGLEKDNEHKDAAFQMAQLQYGERLREKGEQYDSLISNIKQEHENAIAELKLSHENGMAELRGENERRMQEQIAAVKLQLSAESERMLKSRQEEFSRHAASSLGTIADDFNKNLKDMKEAFEANKKSQNDTSAELRTRIEDAVTHLSDRTRDIGRTADRLASALRGENKMQGCWGETQLANVLQAEGLVEGRDYDREETLRDELGIVIHNEETGRRMRPDFILHYPDRTDVVVDCKVSLKALSDYFSAETDAERADASARNLKALREQVENLSRKDYNGYLRTGHKCLDYVLMYVPNVNALVLARQEDPHLVSDSFRKGVLITSEETFMPFLRLVRSACVNYEQARNQEKIVASAQRMIDRVADFCSFYQEVGRKLDEAKSFYDKGHNKITEGGQSILTAAHEVVSLGVGTSARKKLPQQDVAPAVPEAPEQE